MTASNLSFTNVDSFGKISRLGPLGDRASSTFPLNKRGQRFSRNRAGVVVPVGEYARTAPRPAALGLFFGGGVGSLPAALRLTLDLESQPTCLVPRHCYEKE